MSKKEFACTAWNGEGNPARNLLKDGKCPENPDTCEYRVKMKKRTADGFGTLKE
jgi:hypothetical protein